jgi:hypothetical protein
MSDEGMMGDSGFEKRLADNVRRLDEKLGFVQDLLSEKIDHLRSEVQGNDKRYAERFAAQEEANKYDQVKSNEFRGALEDVGKKQMPRTEAEAINKAMTERAEAGQRANGEKIDALQARMDRNEGRGGGLQAGWAYLVGAIGLAATLIVIFMALRR